MKMLLLISIGLLLHCPHLFANQNKTVDCLPKLHCKCLHSRIVCSHLHITALNSSTVTHETFTDNYTELIFSHNSIRRISETTFPDALLGIRHLDFSFNHLEVMEDGVFHSFGELHRLILRHNRISSLNSKTFTGLGHLRELDLSYNRLQSIASDVFSPLRSLQKLHLRYNFLTLLPAGCFQNLLSLEFLDLHSTGIYDVLSNIFRNNSHLDQLYLSGNSFTKIPTSSFTHLSKLKMLQVSDNPVRQIHPLAFEGLTALEELYIENMPLLEVIEEHAFANLSRLKTLSCKYNKRLRTIHSKAFMKENSIKYATRSLEEVFLRHNALTSMTNDTLPWRYIDELDLNDNPWHCDCHLRWMIALSNDNARCESPAAVSNKVIHLLDPKELVCEEGAGSDVHLSVALVISLFLAAFTAIILLLCWRFKVLSRCRSSYQKQYKQMNTSPPMIDRMELDEAPGAI